MSDQCWVTLTLDGAPELRCVGSAAHVASALGEGRQNRALVALRTLRDTMQWAAAGQLSEQGFEERIVYVNPEVVGVVGPA